MAIHWGCHNNVKVCHFVNQVLPIFVNKTIIFCDFGGCIMNGFEGDRTQKKQTV